MTISSQRPGARRVAAAAVLLTAAAGLTTAATPSQAASAGTSASGVEVRPFEPGADEVGADVPAPKSNAPSRVPAANVPTPTPLQVTSAAKAQLTPGLTLRDQRTSNNGNSFSLEPPDQGLCVGAGQVIEGVNNVLAVYTATGRMTSGPTSYDAFWNGTPEFNRATGTYGPFVSDPKCYFDPQLGRFFMTQLELGVDPSTGDFTGDSYEDIAVSKTANPTTRSRDWYLFKLNVRNDGTEGTPRHNGCPCLGDQPLIGADAYGFFITTNEFPIDGAGFNGAQVYAFDKAALTKGKMRYQRIESNGRQLADGIAYSIQPATSPTAGEWSTAGNGTEYALSALEFTGGLDNRIARWQLTNTASLTTSTPQVDLSYTIVNTETYGAPPKVQQKTGAYPLGQSLKQQLNLLDSNDDRMNQVVYAGGKLWSGLNTVVKTPNGPTTTGIAYFVVDAAPARLAQQGYISVNSNSVMYPSIAVTPGGASAAVAFTLAGPDYYPSGAYVRLGTTGAIASDVQVYAAGQAAADGFTGYPAFGGGGVERWGDYSAAVADTAGNIWMATEWIPGTFDYSDGFLANWGTALGKLPAGS